MPESALASLIPTPHADDGLAAGVELPGERGDVEAGGQEYKHRRPLPDGKAVRPTGMPALGHGTAQADLSALYEETALEFNHRIDHLHGELARRAGEIDTTERQAVNFDAGRIEVCH